MDWPRDDSTLHVRTVAVQGATSGQLLATRGVWLLGWTLAEPTGLAAATAALWDGQNAAGQLVALAPLAELGLIIVHPGTPGWPCESGLFMQVLTGTVTGTFTLGEF